MRQALHIFRKDVRHLWPAILVIMTSTGLFTWMGAYSVPVIRQGSSTLDIYNGLIQILMPLGWGYLIAAAIHQEVLPGHQQFWLTRPYSWKSLLAAKGLFILAFVNVPMLLADCVILQIQGFHMTSYWINLVCWQLLFTVVWLLPLAALAAITKNLRQFFLTRADHHCPQLFAWVFPFETGVCALPPIPPLHGTVARGDVDRLFHRHRYPSYSRAPHLALAVLGAADHDHPHNNHLRSDTRLRHSAAVDDSRHHRSTISPVKVPGRCIFDSHYHGSE